MSAQASGTPDVSVIVAVYNVAPYLGQCLESAVAQSIGANRIEVIAVDDGSTDGSGELLDDLAARHDCITVLHEPNSGGPGRPRNVGIERARGRYVFFLDADDYLGTEALERLVAMADRNGSDVVLGRMAGVDGRPVPTSMFRRNLDRADLCTDHVYQSLAPLKLFRRDLLTRLDLRFPEGVGSGEDQPFTARAYFGAGVISVVADYDCYYQRLRNDSQTQSVRADPFERMARYADLMTLVGRNVPAGRCRDRLMLRHVRDLVRSFTVRWARLEPEPRSRIFQAARELVLRWNTERIQGRLSPWFALRVHCLRHGLEEALMDIAAVSERRAMDDAIVEEGRIYAAYPHFRDALAIPDATFDITDEVTAHHRLTRASIEGEELVLEGQAYLALLGGSTDIVLRAERGTEVTFATAVRPTPELRDRKSSYPRAGFDVRIGLDALPAGRWSILARTSTRGYARTGPLGAPDDGLHDHAAGERIAARLFANDAGHLELRVGHQTIGGLVGERLAAGITRLGSRARPRLRRVARSILNWTGR